MRSFDVSPKLMKRLRYESRKVLRHLSPTIGYWTTRVFYFSGILCWTLTLLSWGIFMVMMTPASHEFVDKKLREAAEGIEKAERETAAKKGYKNFELAIRVIYECRT